MLDKMHSMYQKDLRKALAAKPETGEQWAHICWLEQKIKEIENFQNPGFVDAMSAVWDVA